MRDCLIEQHVGGASRSCRLRRCSSSMTPVMFCVARALAVPLGGAMKSHSTMYLRSIWYTPVRCLVVVGSSRWYATLYRYATHTGSRRLERHEMRR